MSKKLQKNNTSSKVKYLVIVESPAKAKTIGKILGPEYVIESSVGHIRDLPVRKIGVNTRKNFEPVYEILPNKEKVVKKLTEVAQKVEVIYLASDPDREGEAIAWHLYEILKPIQSNIVRVRFHEITSAAVKEAFQSAGDLDIDKVSAQQARRILDRLVGYKISPLIRRKVGGRSAGRVQSVAVRLICDREDEIEAFQQEEYWSFEANATFQKKKFPLQLISFDKKRIVAPNKLTDKNICIRTQQEAKGIVQQIAPPKDLSVSAVTERKLSKKPPQPFVTSTLQRTAASVYGFGVKKTMQIAQQLYEGVDIYKNGSPVGLITYMRTDSTRVSPIAVEAARQFIVDRYGEKYISGQGGAAKKSTKSKAQDAHEAIRPTYVDKTPDELRQTLTSDQYKLYKLIWGRFLSSQMSSAEFLRVTVEVKDTETHSVFRTSSQKVTFDGFMVLWSNADDDPSDDDEVIQGKVPNLQKGDIVSIQSVDPRQHFTEPPPRYNEASLVKTLEELGVGRPSTYAATISTVLDREYVTKNDSKALCPTSLGRDVNKVLIEHFSNIVDTEFTAMMEGQLDDIESNNLQWQSMLREFYDPFKVVLKQAQENIESLSIETDYDCPTCAAKMVMKNSFYGPFLACSEYPDCKTTVKLTKEGTPVPPPRASGKDCSKCSTEMNITYGRYGDYLLCPNEDCKHKMPIIKSIGITCPKDSCSGEIIEKKSRFGKIFFGCSEYSNTACDAVFWNKPIAEKCPDCSSILTYKFLKRGDKIACPDKQCGYVRLATEEEQSKYSN